MEDEKLNKPTSRKSSSVNSENGKGKEINDGNDGGEVALKAKMSLLNGITVIVGSIIGEEHFHFRNQNVQQKQRARHFVTKTNRKPAANFAFLVSVHIFIVNVIKNVL